MALVYQSSILSEMVLRNMICFMSEVGILAAKKLMRTLWSVILAYIMLLWKVEI